MKMSAFVIACLLMILVLGSPILKSGVVINKHYQPEKESVQIAPFPSGNIIMLMPIHTHEPEHWVIVINGTVEYNGKRRQKQRELYVSRETYERTSVGDSYTVQASDKTVIH